MQHRLPNITFIRHGMSIGNISDVFDADPALTELGKQQLKETSVAFAGKLTQKQFACIGYTPTKRSYDSALIIRSAAHLDNLPLVSMPDFRERSWGKYEGRSFSSFFVAKPWLEHEFKTYGNAAIWMDDGDKSGLESITEMTARIQRGLDNVYARYGTKPVLLIAHSGSIKIAMHLYRYGTTQKLKETLLHMKTEYGQIYDMMDDRRQTIDRRL